MAATLVFVANGFTALAEGACKEALVPTSAIAARARPADTVTHSKAVLHELRRLQPESQLRITSGLPLTRVGSSDSMPIPEFHKLSRSICIFALNGNSTRLKRR